MDGCGPIRAIATVKIYSSQKKKKIILGKCEVEKKIRKLQSFLFEHNQGGIFSIIFILGEMLFSDCWILKNILSSKREIWALVTIICALQETK